MLLRLDYNLHRKSKTVIFLITLLIQPSIPDQVVSNATYHQYHYPGTYYTSYGTNAETMNGHVKRVHSLSKHHPPARRPFPQTLNNVANGKVILRQVPSLTPQYQSRLLPPISRPPQRQTFSAKSTRKQSIYPVAIKTSCDARKNLLDDIGVLSLITAVISSSVGLYTVIINSMPSNNIGIASGFMSLLLWVPATIISLFNLSGDSIYLVGNLLNSVSFINSLFGFMGVFFGTADVLASMAGETMGIVSFILSVIATFPDVLNAMIEYLFRVGDRRSLEYYFNNYGCSVPGIFRNFGKPIYNAVSDFLVQTIETKGLE